MQASLFDQEQSRKLKETGIQQASSYPFDTPCARARSIAIMLAKRNGTVTADDVWDYLSERLTSVLDQMQPAAWGSVFKSPKLRFTGRVTESKRIIRHAGMIRIWEYINEIN